MHLQLRHPLAGRAHGIDGHNPPRPLLVQLRTDAVSRGDYERGVAAVRERLGRIDILVNNAGVGWYKPFEEWTVDELRDRAAEIGIDGRSDMDKGELIDALRNH